MSILPPCGDLEACLLEPHAQTPCLRRRKHHGVEMQGCVREGH